ncbi:hypothetical protein FOZ60_002449 [Perkinsus olseni]|uniref:Uncharacterized protein n=2 Tax=Perkinsus olseni TaxID=32597 RepID=A0A7J6NY09_PEROL|nr:hypothetical protein FOZ60_002449 [Perkinsus olseni]
MTAAPPLGGASDDQSQQGAWEIVGAVKVKDGLFIGDEMAAQELEFVVTNKVTHVINCCGRQIPNHWEPIGVVYLTYYWLDNDSQVVLDARDVVVDEVTAFVDEALDNAESVLIHSERGQGRSCTVLCAYLMRKYRWGMRKTLEFLQSRRPDVNLRQGYLQQLAAFERRLISYQKMKLSGDWSLSSVTPKLDSEEYLLRNTFMNSQMGPLADLSIRSDADQKRSIDWSDAGEDDKGSEAETFMVVGGCSDDRATGGAGRIGKGKQPGCGGSEAAREMPEHRILAIHRGLGSTRIPTRAWCETSSAAEESPPSRRPATPTSREAAENRGTNKVEMWASGRGDGPRRLPSPTMGSSHPLRSSSRGSPGSFTIGAPAGATTSSSLWSEGPKPEVMSQRFYGSSSGGSYQRSDSPMMRSYQRSATPQLQHQQQERRSLRGLPSSSGMGSLMGSVSSSAGSATTSSLRQQYMGSSSLRSSQGSNGIGAGSSSGGLGMLDPSKRGLPGSAVGRRPSTAPNLANGSSMRSSPTGSYNRPPSPSVRSRPSSPSMRPQRPGSPSPQMMQQQHSGIKGGLVGAGAPFDRVRHRSLTGHMRREAEVADVILGFRVSLSILSALGSVMVFSYRGYRCLEFAIDNILYDQPPSPSCVPSDVGHYAVGCVVVWWLLLEVIISLHVNMLSIVFITLLSCCVPSVTGVYGSAVQFLRMGELDAEAVPVAWEAVVKGKVGDRVSVQGQAVAKRFRGRGCGFVDLQASTGAVSYDPSCGEPLEIIVDGGARAVLKPVHLGDLVRIVGFIQETRRPGALAVRLDNSDGSLEVVQPWARPEPFVGRKGFLTNTATAPHGEHVPPEQQERVYDLKDLPCPLERVCKFFVNNNGRCHRKVCDDVHIQISGRARKDYMEMMRESKSAASHHADDSYAMHEKEKHANRARVFAVRQRGGWMLAGGKGELAVELAALGRVSRFLGRLAQLCSLVSWLACILTKPTGYLQAAAMEFSKPYAIVPCCVFSDEFTDRFITDQNGDEVPVRTHEESCPVVAVSVMAMWLSQGGSSSTARIGFTDDLDMIRRRPLDGASSDSTATGRGWCANSGRRNRRWLVPSHAMKVHGPRVPAGVPPASVTAVFKENDAWDECSSPSVRRRFHRLRPKPPVLGLAPARRVAERIRLAASVASSSTGAVPVGREGPQWRMLTMNTSPSLGGDTETATMHRFAPRIQLAELNRRQGKIHEARRVSFLEHRRGLEESCKAYRESLAHRERSEQPEEKESWSIEDLSDDVEALERTVFREARDIGTLDQIQRYTLVSCLEALCSLLRRGNSWGYRPFRQRWCYEVVCPSVALSLSSSPRSQRGSLARAGSRLLRGGGPTDDDISRAKSRFRKNCRRMREHIDTDMDTLELTLLREQHNRVFREWCYDGKLEVGKPVSVTSCGLSVRSEFEQLRVPDILGCSSSAELPGRGRIAAEEASRDRLMKTRDQRPLVILRQQEERGRSSPRRSDSPRDEAGTRDHTRALKDMMDLLRPGPGTGPTELVNHFKESRKSISTQRLVSDLKGLFNAREDRGVASRAKAEGGAEEVSVVDSVDDDCLVNFIRDVVNRGENLPADLLQKADHSVLDPQTIVSLTKPSEASLAKVFVELDEGCRGELSKEEFSRSIAVFMGVGGPYDSEWYHRLFVWLDSDHRGYMDLFMWLKLASILRQIERTRHVAAFRERRRSVKSDTDLDEALEEDPSGGWRLARTKVAAAGTLLDEIGEEMPPVRRARTTAFSIKGLSSPTLD